MKQLGFSFSLSGDIFNLLPVSCPEIVLNFFELFFPVIMIQYSMQSEL